MNETGEVIRRIDAMNALRDIAVMMTRIQESPTFRNSKSKEEFDKDIQIVMKYITSIH